MIEKVSGSRNGSLPARFYDQNSSRCQQPSFTGGASYTKEITDGLYHAKTIRRMESLKWLKGEIGGILITALGTGMVAPIFIGFNPFVKPPKNATPEQKEETQNTKLYTAMRQPISAVLAILFQASVQKYIDKGLDKVFNDPEIAKYARVNLDQSRLNTESRIKDTIDKEMKQEGKKKPSAIRALFSKKAEQERNAYKDDFNARVKARKESQLDKIASEFEITGKITPGKNSMPDSKIAELVNNQIDEYIRGARKLQKSAEGMIPRYLDRADIIIKNKETLNRILNPIINKGSVTVEELDTLIAQNKDNSGVKLLLEEIKNKPEDLRMHRIKRTIDRIGLIENLCDGNYERDIYRQKLIERNNVLEDIISQLSEQKIKDPKAADANSIKDAIDKIAKICNFEKRPDAEKEILRNTDMFGNKFETIKSKIFKDVTTRYKKLVERNYTSWNQFTKIGVGVLITLPITCTALNWVYPRFMEIFFPKLAGVKKAQQAQKEQAQVGGDK